LPKAYEHKGTRAFTCRELEPEHFEIVAGSRRFRASQMAGMNQVPVRVVALSDAEAQLGSGN
jgi:ParB-like chromosome segregation protein Spo0J